MSEAELDAREVALMDATVKRMNSTPTGVAGFFKQWWGPLTALVVMVAAWTRQETVIEHMESHIKTVEIHSTEDHKRLLIIDQTKDIRDALHEIRSMLEAIRLGQDKNGLKIEGIEKDFDELKKNLTSREF